MVKNRLKMTVIVVNQAVAAAKIDFNEAYSI